MKSKLTGLSATARGYIVAALWTFDDDAPSGEYDAGRADEFAEKLDEKTRDAMAEVADKFAADNAEFLRDYPEKEAGADLWLTRNGHGAGFWENDHGTETDCAALTKAAHALGECGLYFGDDGKIYASR